MKLSEVSMEEKEFVVFVIEKISKFQYDDLISEIEEFGKRDDKYGLIVCSLLSLLFYVKGEPEQAMALVRDAEFLYTQTGDNFSKVVYELIIGYINFVEGSEDIHLLHFDKANILAKKSEQGELLKSLKESIKKLPRGNNYIMAMQNDPLAALVSIGQAVAAEKDIDSLIKTIAEETRIAIQADRCTVFMYDREKNELWSKVALGLEISELRFSASKGLAGHVAMTGDIINIREAYEDSRFNRDIDLQTGYKTKTILCMPIKNQKQEIIGVFQVLNKLEGYFTKEDEDLLVAIGSSAGISLENAQLFETQKKMFEEQKVVFDSFIETLAASIDARDKITAGHSSRVRMYSLLIANEYGLSTKDTEIIEKAAILHDIGKIGIRDSVLQKEGKLTLDEYQHIQEHVEITHNILEKIHMSEDFRLVTEIACSHHEKYNGSGYYRKLSGEDIPFGGRILAVADVFDAITSKRHYRDKMPIKKVISILISDSGIHFDAAIVDKFLNIPLDRIVDVFITENLLEFKPEDREFLSNCTLRTINDSTDENDLCLTLFNGYYMGVVNE